ncbi:MAG TPA: hypothetical protein VJM15_04505 [Sphingomicrobium sp.]|nr:hypothetical protein [Sphingomicrobium sp.]
MHPLPNYRLYHLDGAGKIESAEWLTAADDDDAARQVHERAKASTLELWNRNRLVIRVQPNARARS